MKSRLSINLSFLLITIMAVSLFSCKKNDSAYYNYENTLKEFNGNAFEYLQSQPGVYDSLLVALNRLPALKDSLQNEKVTLFAVTNKSFQISVESLNTIRKRTNKTPLYLKTVSVEELDTMVSRYIVRGTYTTADFQNFADGLLIKSINHNYNMHVLYKKADAAGFTGGGPGIITFSDPKNSIFVRYWQSTPTNAVNIKTNNAIINVVAPGHDFGFGDFVTRTNN
ncbi:hypothetical protein [Pedobacter frigoris]|uniref:hypothetical protein n=1 Tax=Pedobacter frigoris TaxID=2571272 RepID=UPI0029310369|nr:hypothetical protein [Pedobacter frigoris]